MDTKGSVGERVMLNQGIENVGTSVGLPDPGLGPYITLAGQVLSGLAQVVPRNRTRLAQHASKFLFCDRFPSGKSSKRGFEVRSGT